MLAIATASWHQGVAVALVAGNALAAVWSLGAHYAPRLRGWPLWMTIGLAQATTLVAAITGAIMMTRDDRQPPRLHALYGFSAVIAVGILYSYRTSSFTRGKRYLLYAGGSAFIMGLGLRELISLS